MPAIKTRQAISQALKTGPTNNFITTAEAKKLVAAAKKEGADGFDQLAKLYGKAPVSAKNVDSATKRHQSPVLSKEAAAVIEGALWRSGGFAQNDLASLRANAMRVGDVKSLDKGTPAQALAEAKALFMADYDVRASGIDAFGVKLSSLPRAAQGVVNSRGAEAFKLVAAGQIVYAIGVRSADKNSVWFFDEKGKQLGFCSPVGGGDW